MLIVSKVNLAQKANQKSINSTQSQQYSIKTHSQPMRDTVSFTSSLLRNFGTVVEGKLFRGGYPRSVEALQELQHKGIKTLIYLAGNDEAPQLKALVEGAKMKYISNELSTSFGVEDILRIKKLSQIIPNYLDEGGVYLCCRAGELRTGKAVWGYQHFVEKLPEDKILAHAANHSSEEHVAELFETIIPQNFGTVVDSADVKLYRGYKPNEPQLETLKDKGIKSIINLDGYDYKPEEKQLVKELGMEYSFKPYWANTEAEKIVKLKTLAPEIQSILKKGGVYISNSKPYAMADIVAGYQHFIQKLPESKILEYANTSYRYIHANAIEPLLKIFKSTEA